MILRFAFAISTLACVSAQSLGVEISNSVTFDWAVIGNPGNAGELSGGGAGGHGPDVIVGSVEYVYRISKHEVTNAQYVEFLNAVAATDNFGGADPTLYNVEMGSSPAGGITRNGSPGSYTYATKTNFGDKPVTYVSFFDAMRFTNWLHNGQSSGGTESGVYAISDGLSEVRSTDAKYWIPNEDEWYKAAYHDASAGTAGVYFNYATGFDRIPRTARANSVGDIVNSGAEVVNYERLSWWNGLRGNITTVGSAGSTSPYGTFDQNGNVWEWNEAVLHATSRGARGGSWFSNSGELSAVFRVGGLPAGANGAAGFRVATVIPEPSTVSLASLAGISAVAWRFRRRAR